MWPMHPKIAQRETQTIFHHQAPKECTCREDIRCWKGMRDTVRGEIFGPKTNFSYHESVL